MKTTRTFKVSGLASLAGALLSAAPVEAVHVIGILALVFGIPVFAVSATRHLLRGLLWRVGSPRPRLCLRGARVGSGNGRRSDRSVSPSTGLGGDVGHISRAPRPAPLRCRP